MSNKKITHKFSITNLVLVNQAIPFDFFLRVKNTNSQQSQDSPLIQANKMQCDQVFPWQFAVSQVFLKVQFIQITKSTRVQIVRSQFNVSEVTDQDGQTIVMFANRSSKKLCIVTYKLQPYNLQRRKSKQKSPSKGKEKNKNEQQNEQAQGKQKKKAKKPERVVFSKQQHEQLSRQIAKINKSIDKILDHQKTQHALFNKYLDESTSFIKQMLSQSRAIKNNQSESQKQSSNQNEKENQRREKQKQRLRDRQRERQRERDRQRQRQNQQQNKGLDNILKQIEQQSEERSQLLENNSNTTQSNKHLTSKSWYKNKFKKEKPQILKNINYRKQGAPSTSNLTPDYTLEYFKQPNALNSFEQSSLILSDLSVNSEVVPNQIRFFDPETDKLILSMKSKNGPGYQWKKSVQLPHKTCLIVTILDNNKKIELIGCISKKQFQSERVSMYSKNGEQKGFIRFKFKLVNAFSVQTQQMLNIPNQSQVTNQNQAQKIKPNKKITLQPQAQPQKEQLQQDQEQEQGNEKQNQLLNKQKQEHIQKRYQLSRSSNKSTPKNMRVRKLSVDYNKNQNKKIQKQQMQNKQDSQQINQKQKRFQFISNSISVAYLPRVKKYTSSQNSIHHRSSIQKSDEQNSQASSTYFLSKLKTVNLKIDTVSAKLSNNPDHFVGKFIKLSMRNKSSFTTQIINLSQNLTWKCKGCLFENVSPYGQLLVQLFNDDSSKPKLIGKSKICLALINLQKSNKIQFYHQFLRDSNQNQIGELILSYQNLQKIKRSSSNNKIEDQDQKRINQVQKEDGFNEQQNQNTLRVNKKNKKKSKSKAKKKTEDPQGTNRTQKKSHSNIGVEGSQAKIVGSSSAIRAKKYTGGNIIIGRAARFRLDPKQQPGPGQYEVPSQFQRHALD